MCVCVCACACVCVCMLYWGWAWGRDGEGFLRQTRDQGSLKYCKCISRKIFFLFLQENICCGYSLGVLAVLSINNMYSYGEIRKLSFHFFFFF